MKQLAILIYGSLSYLYGMAILVYTVLFVENLIVPITIDHAPTQIGYQGLIPSLLFILLFAVQHTIMARPFFKKSYSRFLPVETERSSFVLLTAAILHALFYHWTAYPAPIWDFSGSIFGTLLTVISLLGFTVGLIASFQIDHFELFGLKQVISRFRKRPFQETEFVTPFLYRYVRHPLMTGFLVGFWSAPKMSEGHLVFAATITLYVLFGIRLEERDMAEKLGEPYLRYAKNTPRLIPNKLSPSFKINQ